MSTGNSIVIAQAGAGLVQAVWTASNESESIDVNKSKPHPQPFLLRHTLFLLPLAVVISASILLLSYVVPFVWRWVHRRVVRKNYEPLAIDDDAEVEAEPVIPTPYLPSQGLWADFRAHIRSLRSIGTQIVLLEFLRFLALGTLLGLSIYATIQAESPESNKGTDGRSLLEALKKKKKKKKKNKNKVGDYSSLEWGEFGACFFYLYNILFSFLLLTMGTRASRLRRRLTRHVDVLLLLAFALFAYRDIWPELTTYLSPSDLDNAITWSRVGILGATAILIPGLRPGIYVPVDPLNPTPADQIHPEQTASFLSFIFYEFMTPLVLKAWKVSALPYDDIHPLADYDHADVLFHKYGENLDPIRRREKGLKPLHLFYGLVYSFRVELLKTSAVCVIVAAAELIPTICINQLLTYLATDGVGAKIRPIVWVALLFIGPTISSMLFQYYIFIMTRCLVRSEAVLSQLIFDHALRLRIRDTIGDDSAKPAADVPTIEVEDTGSSTSDTEAGSATKGDKSDTKGDSKSTEKAAKGQGMVGKINVLISQDIESIVEGRDLPLLFVYTPIQLGLALYVLFKLLSWSALFGVAFMVLTLPLPGLLTKLSADVQTKRMAATDTRVDTVTEAVGALRIIKMFGWEDRIKARIAVNREEELVLTWRRRIISLLTNLVNMLLPIITMGVSFAAYTLIQKRPLTAATVFSSMTVLELLKGIMMMSFWFLSEYVNSYVSVKRLNDFLQESDMVDVYSQGHRATIQTPEQLEAEANGLIRIKNAAFAWGVDNDNKNIINFRLRIPDLTFVKGGVNLITGPTGSGKSSLLQALIGELHFEPWDDKSFFYLPRDGGVSYAAQESWCMSCSVKDNILFGRPYDDARYRQVLHDCALLPDLKLFEDGDETEIGEKGVTLSGGQKARITLARAIYCNTAVVLLDDIFSALDTLTSRFILDNLFKGDLIKDRTILLVTHHVGLSSQVADFVVTLNENGTIARAGPIDSKTVSTASSVVDLSKMGQASSQGSSQESESILVDTAKPANKLIKDEEKSEGRISRRALFSFFSTFGGPAFWFIYFGLLIAGQAVTAFQTYWLGLWTKAYDRVDDPSQVSVAFWLGLEGVWVILGMVTTGASVTIFYIGAMKASRVIHAKLVDTIFGAPMRFLDSTPVGRILGRFTKDIRAVDMSFTELSDQVLELSVTLIIKFITVVIFVPLFSVPAVIIGALGAFIGELYIHAQLSVKREQSNAKTPLFSHLAGAVSGIVSIRAYAAQDQMRAETRVRADKYTRAATAFYNLNRWVTLRIDMLGGAFSAALGAFLVYASSLDAAISGFALTQAISFAGMILWWVRTLNEFEVQGNAVERIEDYLVIDQETPPDDSKKPPAAWPTSGEIVLKDLCAKYFEGGPTVLDNLNVHIASGERVGIVGRTGSGKSTLALAMLRMLPTSGTVMIDGIQTDKINLHDLRSRVTIIPQDPILLSGSLRGNLDPFDEVDDATLNDAMEASGLTNVRRSENGTTTPMRLTLDTLISAGGSNLSQGQRQLVALARALVRNSKVLILDEATASVDFETDAVIQQSIRNLPSSTTVLTVAHRLATVMDYDKILVLGKGKVLEFDSPETLKNNKDSYFAQLVQAMEG